VLPLGRRLEIIRPYKDNLLRSLVQKNLVENDTDLAAHHIYNYIIRTESFPGTYITGAVLMALVPFRASLLKNSFTATPHNAIRSSTLFLRQ
jgi:hypothetical protein